MGLFDRADLQPGESVLIHAAAGGSGSPRSSSRSSAVPRCSPRSAPTPKKQLCLDLGADVVINYTTEDFAAVVLAETANRGVDVVFDNVGEAVWAPSLKCIAYNGRYLMMGFASDKRDRRREVRRAAPAVDGEHPLVRRAPVVRTRGPRCRR